MPNGTVARADRRRWVSPRFKHRLAVRVAGFGLVVVAAICLAFGPIGIGVGLALLVGLGGFVYFRRQRRATGIWVDRP